MSAADESNVMLPVPMRVLARTVETDDTVSLTLEAPGFGASPGQFCMLYVFGVGEIPISISALAPEQGRLVHTVRSVGAVSAALVQLREGDEVFVRGPFGVPFPMHEAREQPRIVVAGGLGLAPLRPVIHAAIADGGPLTVLIGARSPSETLFADEVARWQVAGVDVRTTVDRAEPGYTGRVGFVTALIENLDPPADARAFVCGPEVMMRAAARSLVARGLAARNVHLSLERSMKCGVGLCGHCQLGPLLLCTHGPVVDAERAGPLLATREL